jgi:hypothetical protein
LFSDALHFTISLNFKLKENNELLPSFESLMKDEFGLANELILLGYNIQKEFCCVFFFFLTLEST